MTILEQLFAEVPKAKENIYKIGKRTPLERISLNGENFELYIKREDLGPINAYKWRGAYNAVLNHHKETGCDTIVAASAGNHAQGVALAARKLGIKAKIFMPLAAPLMKQKAVMKHGGNFVELILEGDTYNEAGDAAKKYVAETGYTYIHPFDDLYTMAGQALIADEIVEESDTPFDYAFLQIGGGGMAGAVSAWLKKHYPDIKIIGVEGEKQASMKASVESGKPITLDSVDTFCDGTAVTRPGDLTFEVCSQSIDDFVTVSNDEVSAAIQQLWNSKRLIPEPSGAMGLAGLNKYAETHETELKGKKVLCIICGANMDFNKLSIIARKSAVGAHKRRYYRLELPECEGSLLKTLETHFKDLNVSEFMYGKIHESQAWQTIAIDGKKEEFDALETSLKQANIDFEDITSSEDIRYKVINYNPALFNLPVFLNIKFPERKGALRDLLRAISPVANICYFNYAYSGEVIGRALMGFEFSSPENKEKFFKLIDGTVVTYQPVNEQTEKRIVKY
ncbi:MAG: pyridoxal-5'-phosphate-dependent protein [Micavibrio sp.]|nr:pyridoxal-5'-phosphate-dependent protein [Micavibrio sp.]